MNDIKRQKEKEKKGVQALYKSIKIQSETVLVLAIRKSGMKVAYQQVRADVLNSLFGTFNKNLSLVKKLLINPKEHILNSINYSGQPYEDFGKLYTVIAESEKIINLLEEEREYEIIPDKLKNRLDSLKEDFEKISISDLGIIEYKSGIEYGTTYILSNRDYLRVMDKIWHFILKGYLAPGRNILNPWFPNVHLTEEGKKYRDELLQEEENGK